MWRLGIRNSYTMESTFGGSTLGKHAQGVVGGYVYACYRASFPFCIIGNRKGTHFSTRDLKSLGYYLCDTLLDYCDPDPTKVSGVNLSLPQ